MRRAILEAGVRLDLDDPADPEACAVLADEERPEEPPRGDERLGEQHGAREGTEVRGVGRRLVGAQRRNALRIESGISGPHRPTNTGISVSRMNRPVVDRAMSS